MKLLFILVICCILSLVSAQCDCDPNCELPQCGKKIERSPDSCRKLETNKTKLDECNKIHFRQNLNNDMKCPNGTKAWPLMFIWTVTYDLAAPDDVERYVYKINNNFPPPTIHAIKGDWILIRVINNIKKDGKPELTTIHWHGITMRGVERQTIWTPTEQPGFPFMDGVPGINQCAIPGYNNTGKNKFDYFFQFMDSGTFWYHSHYGSQIADGLSGPMIVKDCEDVNRVKNLNDYGLTYNEEDDWKDNIIAVNDWFSHTTAEKEFNKYKYTTKQSKIKLLNAPDDVAYLIPIEPEPNNGLINGVGNNKFTIRFVQGKTYRLRLINMSSMSLFTFSIQNHTFEVIEVEGMLVKRNKDLDLFKRNFTELTINSGQRYSILVNANQKNGVYGMRFYSKGCQRHQQFTQEINGTVRYDGYDDVNKQLEAKFNRAKTSCTDLPKDALIPYCDNDTYTLFCKPPPKNDTYFVMKIIINTTPENIFGKDPYMQNVVGSLARPKGYNFQTYWDHKWSNLKNNTLLDIYKDVYKDYGDNDDYFTKNYYSLNKANIVQDIFFDNIDELEHPIHLHGHFFYVLGFGTNSSKITLNEINPIQRDTITVPPRGWAQIRFVIDNPGVWPMHCHIDWHLGTGMLAQFVELDDEIKNRPPKEWCEACDDAECVCTNCTSLNVAGTL